jgi:hypothetical protein
MNNKIFRQARRSHTRTLKMISVERKVFAATKASDKVATESFTLLTSPQAPLLTAGIGVRPVSWNPHAPRPSFFVLSPALCFPMHQLESCIRSRLRSASFQSLTGREPWFVVKARVQTREVEARALSILHIRYLCASS